MSLFHTNTHEKMVEQEEAVSVNSKPEQGALCEECTTKPSKYKCPGCSIRSCSLPCVKAHKERTGCTGKRSLTEFVPISQFDDNLLLSDYNMLEDVKRVAESARRVRAKVCGYANFRLPFPLKSLRSAAATRKTKLFLLYSGMSRRETNRSYYNNRKKFICWTVEWRFHSTDVVLIDHGVHENSNMRDVIEKHMKPGPWNHPLKKFCEAPLDSLKFFIRKYPKGSRSPFRELDINLSLRQQLANLVVLEYPVIHVFLPSHSFNFEVVKDVIPTRREYKESIDDTIVVPEGITFREEEIDDKSSSDPQVLDLMKHVKPNVASSYSQNQRTNKETNNTADKPSSMMGMGCHDSKPVSEKDLVINKAECNNIIEMKARELGLFEDMGFDFEQGLVEAYSDLIAQTNPDDFLDLENLLMEGVELDGKEDTFYNDVFAIDHELEEGEIPEF